VADDAWYWGVVVRAAPVDPLLRHIAELDPPPGVSLQAVGTGHVTLFYAPLRTASGDFALARRMEPIAAATSPFTIELSGLGEFVSEQRVVAWLGVGEGEGADILRSLRSGVCAIDDDTLPHSYHPHCTVAYGEDPAAYARFRPQLLEAVDGARVPMLVDRLWVAGFPAGSHPARGLGYRMDLPLAGIAAVAPAGV
jgi:2'-5' RNA ligase